MCGIQSNADIIVYLGRDPLDKSWMIYECEQLGHTKEHLILHDPDNQKVDRYGCNICKYCYDITPYAPEPTESRRKRSKKAT